MKTMGISTPPAESPAPAGATPTLLLSQRYTPDSNALWRAALDAGWDLHRVHGLRLPPGFTAAEPVLYGETLLADAISQPLGLAMLEPSADWLPRLPEPYRRRSVRLLALAQAREERGPIFIKPTDEKLFPARVYARGADVPAEELDPALPVLVSEPVAFTVEFRLFVLERQVVAWSPYIRESEIARTAAGVWASDPAEDAAALAFAAALLADPAAALPPAVVVDVGLLRGGGFAVVEANAAWASGVCGCDPRAVLPVLRRACQRQAALRPEDQRWVRGAG